MVGEAKSRVVYNGRVVKLRVDVLGDDVSRVREVVEHPGAVAILPVLPDGRVVLIKQYRHPVGKWILEVPAGTLRPGESPDDCARRELEEETGYVAGKLDRMLTILPSPGYSTERITLYVASNLYRGVQSPEEDEEIKVVEKDLEEAIGELLAGGEADGKTLLALLIYRHRFLDGRRRLPEK